MSFLAPLPTLTSRPLAWLRARFRASEAWFITLAIVVGAGAGVLAVVQSRLAHTLQEHLYGIAPDIRLSALETVDPMALLWLPVGGLVLAGFGSLHRLWRNRPIIDVVEANSLYGGRMSLRGSLVICIQTLISNGFGASVGLEAAYAQAGGGLASAIGQRLRLRRHDLRTLVGAGAGAAIGAAFGAPLTGAFYAFEVVIGSYAPSMIAPVAAACLAAVAAATAFGVDSYAIHVSVTQTPTIPDYALYAGLGGVCAVFAIVLMLLVARGEQLAKSLPMPASMRLFLGGTALAGLALISPQTLSSGHGALHHDLFFTPPVTALATILALKTVASVVSLSTGFRGGLFFASLFLGSLVGQIYARLLAFTNLPAGLDPQNAALVGMGALATAVVGGPLTMSFLVLETTHNFGVTAATLAASLVASSLVRERFGYSFSTWRLHLRGETIRSARDVGWVRTLTAGRMMRTDVPTIAETAPLSEFRRRFPLGGPSRVVLLDEEGHYAGIAPTAAAYVEGHPPDGHAAVLALNKGVALTPAMNISEVMQTFDATQTEELAVIDPSGVVLGVLAEVYVSKRYAKELERVQEGVFGES
ncbi:chloride channel protein [Phenylobacterium sp. LjRoot225]|uniref:chloride channel protein n=1 Tax=Phenylobacterium sp. LjRoot225 TaxID=3342285 RepID=UPI003ECFA04B